MSGEDVTLRAAGDADLQPVLSFVRACHAFEGVEHTPAHAACVRALRLEVERTNLRARRLYRAAGLQDRERYFLMSARLTGESGAKGESGS